MSKSIETTEVIQRKVGENVNVFAHFEPTLTKDLGAGVIEATISTGALDHHNEKILIDGVDTSSYHGTVLYGHDYQGLPIGKTIALTKTKNAIKAKFQMAVDEYPFAKTVYDLIKGGYLTDVSIGGIVKKWSEDYTTIEAMSMKEFSVVPIGANQQAMITGKSLGEVIDPEEFTKQYHDFMRKSILDKMATLGEDEVNQSIKTLENLLGILKESAQAVSSGGEVKPEQIRRIARIRLQDSAKAVVKEAERTIRLVKLK
jgi:HK97 family phage prohead protease